MVGNMLGTILKTPTNDDSLVVFFANDKNRADDARGKALQYDSLVVVNRNLRAVVGEWDGVGRGRGVVGLRWWWWRGVDTSCRLGYIDDVHDEGV